MFVSPVHTRLTSIFLPILLLTILNLPSTAYTARRMCSPSNRSPIDSCSQDFQNMCTFFSGDGCEGRICQKLTHNDCTACSDPTVLYYSDTPCSENKVYCDPNMRPSACPEENAIVCGFTREGCTDESCRINAFSGCQACQDPTILFYTQGECQAPEILKVDSSSKTTSNCGNFDFANDCSQTDPKPVCAFFTENCDKDICSATAQTSCDACSDPSILYYQEGECQVKADQRTYCFPTNRITECPQTSQPVCGVSFRNCEGGLCEGTTFTSECSACSDPSVSYHTPGECVISFNQKDLESLSPQLGEIDRVFQQEQGPCINCSPEKEDEDDFIQGFSEEEFLLNGNGN